MAEEKYVGSPRKGDFEDIKSWEQAYRKWYYNNVTKPKRDFGKIKAEKVEKVPRGRPKEYVDSPERKDFPDTKSYRAAYHKWYYDNVKGPLLRDRPKIIREFIKNVPIKMTFEERSELQQEAKILKSKKNTAKCEAEIAERVTYLDTWYGPDMDVENSTYLLKNISKRNPFYELFV